MKSVGRSVAVALLLLSPRWDGASAQQVTVQDLDTLLESADKVLGEAKAAYEEAKAKASVPTFVNAGFKLEDGDVLQAIDGRKPDDGPHALRILRSYRSGETLNLTVLRQRKPVTLAVTCSPSVGMAPSSTGWVIVNVAVGNCEVSMIRPEN
jgi:hypothetical protein